MDKFRTIFGAGFFSALVFGAFGAPQKWQWLALATGAAIAAVLTLGSSEERGEQASIPTSQQGR